MTLSQTLAEAPVKNVPETILKGVRPNIVQSIRAFRVQDLQDATLEKGKELVDSADNYVRENPWQAVGLAAAVGVLIGMLIARK